MQIYDLYLIFSKKVNYSDLERILSKDRLTPYLTKHSGNTDKALSHYKANIRTSEAFYSLISVFEIGLS